jgi:tetratricopeptide (TPR) repeat protein
MGFEFEDLTNSSAVAALRWEKLKVPIKIELDVHEIVLTHARNSHLRGQAAFSWQSFNQAAGYCLQNNVNFEEGLTWADKSVSMNENATNLTVKAGLLQKLGKATEANAVREKALKVATTEGELNTLGYQYLGANSPKQAIDVFKRNAKAHPDSWNVYNGLGEAYEKLGNTKEALENYNKALKLTKDEGQQKRLTEAMKKLEGK